MAVTGGLFLLSPMFIFLTCDTEQGIALNSGMGEFQFELLWVITNVKTV